MFSFFYFIETTIELPMVTPIIIPIARTANVTSKIGGFISS